MNKEAEEFSVCITDTVDMNRPYWIDLTSIESYSEFEEKIKELGISKHWRIGEIGQKFPKGVKSNIQVLLHYLQNRWALLLGESRHAYKAYCEFTGFVSATGEFNKAYECTGVAPLDFAKTKLNNMCDTPAYLKEYIDYQKYADDIFRDEYYYDEESTCIFRRV